MKDRILMVIACILFFVTACSSEPSLEKISKKEVSQYTLADCKIILLSSQEDIYSAFNVSPEKDLVGLLLEERTLAVPVIRLNNCIYYCRTNVEYFVISKDSETLAPFSLVLFGDAGTKTVLTEFINGMVLDETKYQAFDTFWKGFEGGEQLPAKRLELTEDDLVIQVYFTQRQGDSDFTLNSIHVTMFV